jgi:hypothetical protein
MRITPSLQHPRQSRDIRVSDAVSQRVKREGIHAAGEMREARVRIDHSLELGIAAAVLTGSNDRNQKKQETRQTAR